MRLLTQKCTKVVLATIYLCLPCAQRLDERPFMRPCQPSAALTVSFPLCKTKGLRPSRRTDLEVFGALEHFCYKQLAAAMLNLMLGALTCCSGMSMHQVKVHPSSCPHPSAYWQCMRRCIALLIGKRGELRAVHCNLCMPSAMHAESLRAGMLRLYQVSKTLSKLCATLLSCL